ncbi:MAG TPA: hypothetical protein VMU83_20655 [Hanamia sp.]|nr:hypothetical protein [Hanamia sp.]
MWLCQRRHRDAGAHRELPVFSRGWHVHMSVGKQKNCDRTTRQAVWIFFYRVLCQAKKIQNNHRPEKSEAEQNHDRHGEERTCLA